MCGRFTLKSPLNKIFEAFEVPTDGLSPLATSYVPRYNIAPTQQIVAVRQSDDGRRELTSLQWGLIPSWAKDEKIGYSTINARAETVADKPAFRSAFKRRRCLVVADGWYEWQAAAGSKSKQPYRMHYPDDRMFGLAGLWESWKQGDRMIESCTIIVTAASPRLAAIHDRSPCIIRPRDYTLWLDPEFESRPAVEAMLQPADDAIEAYRVSAAVGNVRNQAPELIAPLDC